MAKKIEPETPAPEPAAAEPAAKLLPRDEALLWQNLIEAAKNEPHEPRKHRGKAKFHAEADFHQLNKIHDAVTPHEPESRRISTRNSETDKGR